MRQGHLNILLSILLLSEPAALANPGTGDLQGQFNQACGSVLSNPNQKVILASYCKASSTAYQGVSVYEGINQSWNATASVCQGLCDTQGSSPISYDAACDTSSFQSIDLDSTQSQQFAGLNQTSNTLKTQQAIAQQAEADHKAFRNASACQEAQWATLRANARQAMADDYRDSFSSTMNAIATLEDSSQGNGVSGSLATAANTAGAGKAGSLGDSSGSSADGGRNPASGNTGLGSSGDSADRLSVGIVAGTGGALSAQVSGDPNGLSGNDLKVGGTGKTLADSASGSASRNLESKRLGLLVAGSESLASDDGISADTELSLFVRVTRRYVQEVNKQSIY